MPSVSEGHETEPKRSQAAQDFSKEIESGVERERSDRVRCVRVFGNFYRCNWWAPLVGGSGANATSVDWLTSATHRVRKSCLFSVTLEADSLLLREVIERASATGPQTSKNVSVVRRDSGSHG